MSRAVHDRLLDHAETDLDTNVVLNGAIPSPGTTASGATVHQALLNINAVAGGGGGGGTVKSAKGRGTGADTITTFTEQKVTIGDNTLWDDWGTMVSGDDFVVPTGQGGKFHVLGNCELAKSGGASPTTGWVELSIRDSAGTTFYAKANVMYTAILISQSEFPLCSVDVALADGASVSLWVANNMDHSIDLDNGGGPFCGSLAIEKLS